MATDAKIREHIARISDTTVLIIAQRIAQDVNTDYKPFVRKMIETALDKLAILE